MFIIIWKFSVAPDRDGDFRLAYGLGGDWSRLFALGNGYLGTELVACEEPGGYLTIDRWEHEANFDDFMTATSREYAELDRRLAALTIAEELIGRGTVALEPSAGRSP